MFPRSISLLRFSRISRINHQLVTRHLLHEKPAPQQLSQFGFYSPFNRHFHLDQAYRQQEQHTAIVEEKMNSFEMNQQIPTRNNRSVVSGNHFGYDVLKEKPEYNHYQNIAMIHKDSFTDFEPHYLTTSPGDVESLLKDIENFDSSQILALLRSLVLHTPFRTDPGASRKLPNDSNFWLIIEKLDQCCLQMLDTMSPDFGQSKDFLPFMAMANFWSELGIVKHSRFIEVLTKKLYDFEGPLCDYSFLQLMFLINIQRRFPHELRESFLQKTEEYLRNESSISAKELTLVARTFWMSKTGMQDNVLTLFIEKCTAEFNDTEKPNFIASLLSILRVIRYSFRYPDRFPHVYAPKVKQLVYAILRHPEQYINSAHVAADLILTLNCVKLQDDNALYKLVFGKMIEDLNSMRIGHIEQVLSGLADARFMPSKRKLKTVEEFVCNSMDAQLYPNNIHNIHYSLRIMGYNPQSLLKMMQEPKFLQRTLDMNRWNCYRVLLLNDTILRLLPDNRSPAGRLLTDEQVESMRPAMYKDPVFQKNKSSKHAFFLRSIRDVLQPKYGSALKFIYLFPSSSFPFPVILDEMAQKTIEKYQSEGTTMTERIEPPSIVGDDVIPYNPKFCTPNLFKGSTALQLLFFKDKLNGGKVRGIVNMEIMLLEALGLKVLELHQKKYRSFLKIDPDSADYANSSQRLLTFIESNH